MNYINLKGKWENEFGSIMDITQTDSKTGIFSGNYQSDTGATGIYYFTGITDIAPDPNTNSQTISFSVSWRSFEGDNDESKYWTSAFAGQVQIIDKQQVISTTYLLQKNSPPADNWGATIVASSTFRRCE